MQHHFNQAILSFVGTSLPVSAADTHFCFIGATGSGKTVSIRLLMQTAFSAIGKGKRHRALVYDAKRDFLPILGGIVDPSCIIPLNPFDERSFVWDMAKDIKTPANALQLATILIPSERNSSQPFFADAARHLLAGVVTALMIKAGEEWTFRDVIWTMLDQNVLVEVLRDEPKTKHIANLYFSHEGTAQNIMSTIATKLNPFSIIAALWEEPYKQGRRLSLSEWVKGESVLVLGNDHTNKAAVDALNQIIFKRISELILDQEERKTGNSTENDGTGKTWIILDEFVRAGKLEGTVELATAGRSKGVSIVLGFQDLDGARAVYGKEVAEEIIGQCSNLAIMRLQSPETSEWASRLFGKFERIEKERSESKNETDQLGIHGLLNLGSSTGEGVTYRRMVREAVLSSEFMSLPVTSKDNGITCFLFSPFFQNNKSVQNAVSNEASEKKANTNFLRKKFIDGEKLFGGLWSKSDVPTFLPRDGSHQFLSPWIKEDWERLNLLSAYHNVELREEIAKKRERERFIRDLAYLQRNNVPSELQALKTDELKDAKTLKLLSRKRELEQRREEEKALEDLATLWALRNPAEGEEDEINALSENDQQDFYRKLEELSGKPAVYRLPEQQR